MTQKQQESICSDETEPSLTKWTDTSKLGRAIVSQLSIDEYNTLGRWMAFRLAELLDRGDSEDSERRPQPTSSFAFGAYVRTGPTHGLLPQREIN